MVVSLQVDVVMRSGKLAALRRALQSPVGQEIVQRTKAQLIRQIRGTGVDSEHRFLPYHTYPPRSGSLEASAFVEPIKGKYAEGISIGSTMDYATVLEYGRRAMRRTKHPFIFQGFYPNERIVRRAMRDSLQKHSSMESKKIRVALTEVVQYIRGETAEQSFYLQSKGTEKATISRQRIARRIGRNLGRNLLNSVRVPAKLRAQYPFGLYTVFAYRVRRIEPYRVFSKTAEWAQGEIEEKLKMKVKEINAMS